MQVRKHNSYFVEQIFVYFSEMAEIHSLLMLKIFIFQDEMKEWLFPTSFDYLAAEASHLIYHADSNEV